MNLLGAKLYDPSSAVTKSAGSLLAMTALDTTNLRIAFTIPSHGFVFVRLRTLMQAGSAIQPKVFLGILDGATVVARVQPHVAYGQTTTTTSYSTLLAEFIVPGLTPGAVDWDAAYGVEIITASNIAYGGPNNTTANDAWGAFVFEVWDPQPTTGDAFARLGAPAGASMSADVAAVKSDTAGVKAKTDSLTFTKVNEVDTNIQSVNNVTVAGTGASGDEWGAV